MCVSALWQAGNVRRFLFDSEGNLRLLALILLFLAVPVVVLALATWGGWSAMVIIAALVAALLAAAIAYG